MRRRDFIAGLGSAAAWPLAARAQQGDRVRRIGVLMPYDENDPLAKTLISAFIQALAGLGWTDGRNVRMDLRWYGDDINRIRALAQELVGLQPDIILADTTPATAAVQRETRTIPIVFGGNPVASCLAAMSFASAPTGSAGAPSMVSDHTPTLITRARDCNSNSRLRMKACSRCHSRRP